MSSKYFSKIYDSWKNIQKEKYEIILDIFIKNKIKFSEVLVLDLGCGPFYFEEFLEDKKIKTKNFILFDKDRKLIGKRNNFVLGDLNRLPFKKEVFDIVFCIDVLHFIDNPKDLKYLVKKGGFVLISQFLRVGEDINKSLKKFEGFKILEEFLFNCKEKEIIILLRSF